MNLLQISWSNYQSTFRGIPGEGISCEVRRDGTPERNPSGILQKELLKLRKELLEEFSTELLEDCRTLRGIPSRNPERISGESCRGIPSGNLDKFTVGFLENFLVKFLDKFLMELLKEFPSWLLNS